MIKDAARLIFEAVLASSEPTATALLGTVATAAMEGISLRVEMGEDFEQPFFEVRWTIDSALTSQLVISPNLPPSGRVDYIADRLALTLPLILAYHQNGTPALGTVNLNLEDYSNHPGISFCSNIDNVFLVPDTEYMATRGYADFQQSMTKAPMWRDRTAAAFWRGSTTGLIWAVGSWRELPRLRLCAIARARPDLFDAGISSVVQIEPYADEIAAAGFLSPPVPAVDWAAYRYQIDIDGNSNAWAGYYQRLLTGSPVLKVASPFGFRQWFYHRMEPWRHYVPVEADMSDLTEKIEWLNANEQIARLIGEAGRQFALSLTFEGEMRVAVLTIAAAIRSGRT